MPPVHAFSPWNRPRHSRGREPDTVPIRRRGEDVRFSPSASAGSIALVGLSSGFYPGLFVSSLVPRDVLEYGMAMSHKSSAPRPGGRVREDRDFEARRRHLEMLFEAHHVRVYRSALRITGDPDDAEDVLQTLFLRLAKKPSIDCGPNPEAWFHRAAVNGALDLLRRRRIRLIKSDALSAASACAPTPRQARGASPALTDELRDALSALPPRWAEMFVLRYIDELTNQEIARLFDTSPSVVAVTLYRARRDLRKALS